MKNKLEEINCDLCGSNQFKFVTRQKDIIHKKSNEYFNIVRCENCGLHFTNPRPTKESISLFYSENYSFHKYDSKIKFLIRKVFSKIVQIKFIRYLSIFFPNKLNLKLIPYILPKIQDPIFKYIDENKNSEINFLDIGCGTGSHANFWGSTSTLLNLHKTINVYGVEPSQNARSQLDRMNIKTFESINNIERNKKFQIIRLNWSLEHVHEPSLYFEFLENHLTQNSIAIICVPNNNGIIYKINNKCLELPIHLYHFDKQTLEKYANKYNLEKFTFRTFSYPMMYIFAYQLGLIKTTSKLDKMNLIQAKKLLELNKILDENELGNDILFVLKKKKKND